MNCPSCGVEVPSDAGFCHECGTELPGAAAQASTAPEPAAKQAPENYLRTTQQCPVLDRPGAGATEVAVVESGAILRVLSRDWIHVDGRDYVKVAYEGRPSYIDRGHTVPGDSCGVCGKQLSDSERAAGWTLHEACLDKEAADFEPSSEPARFAALADTPVFRDPDGSAEIGVLGAGSGAYRGGRERLSAARPRRTYGAPPSEPPWRQGGSSRPGAEFVAKALFVVGWAALVLGLLGAIGAASADYCQDTFFSDCSGEGNMRVAGFFFILILSILYALPNFALSYTLKYLAELERRGT